MEKKAKKKLHLGFWIVTILAALLWFFYLEINKNTLSGWIQSLVVFLVYITLSVKLLRGKKWFVRLGAFLVLLLLLWAIGRGTLGPYKARPAIEGETGGVTGIVTVRDGQLTGVTTADGAVEVYAGIPYAKPPVGELRWREPQAPEPWQGVLAADAFAPMSMQPQNAAWYSSMAQIIGYHDYEVSLDDNFRDRNSEDALYLNIWKPAGAQADLPVLVYIHGGSLQTGQPWYADYRGEGLARKGVIVVNMGYRLGIFGFLADEELMAESPNGTTGNYGLLDQIKALEWVRDNIVAFGGDPGNVTLAGESAGAACVSALCTSPLAKGLFRRVIAESSTVTAPQPAHSFQLLEEGLENGKRIKERFGVSSIEELRQLDAKTLAAAADRIHHMTVDGYVLPETPYKSYRKGIHNEEAILHGFNAQEGTAFILFDNANLKNYEEKVGRMFGEEAPAALALRPSATDAEAKANWIDLYSAYFFSYGHYCWSRQAQTLDLPCYEYYFSKSNGRLGPWHSGEEVYCYGNIPAASPLYDESDRALSETFCSYFANFCKTGDPNGPGLPRWEQAGDGKTLLELGEQVGPREDPYLGIYELFDKKYEFGN